MAGVQNKAIARQEQHLGRLALRLEDYLEVAAQMVRVCKAMLGRDEGRMSIDRDLKQLLDASSGALIFGVGVFYSPTSTASPRTEYVYGPDRKPIVPRNLAYKYWRRPWYVAAHEAGGRIVFTGPYLGPGGRAFVSASSAFTLHGQFGGVVLIDSLRSGLDGLLSGDVPGDERAYVTDDDGRVILGTSDAPAESTVSTTLRMAPWHLHIGSNLPAVRAYRKKLLRLMILASAGYWLLGGTLIWLVARVAWFQRERVTLREVAYQDALTGLWNRAYIYELFNTALQRYRNVGGETFAALFIDLDNFSLVNDSLGHHAGDSLLQSLSDRLSRALPNEAVAGRIGGDEFAVYVPIPNETKSEQYARTIAQSLIDEIGAAFSIGSRDVFVSTSVGIAIGSIEFADAAELLRAADTAMYAAKRQGSGRAVLFDRELHEEAIAKVTLESDLRRAIRNGEFVPYYQPIHDVVSGAIQGIEALARWPDQRRDNVSALEFIALAEQMGEVCEIDRCILFQACRDAARLQKVRQGLTVSVNISAKHFVQPAFVAALREALEASGIDPTLLRIELTETAVMEHSWMALDTFMIVRALGAHVDIDDFGTGHSSLSYVQRLPISGLKVDRSFIEPITAHSRSATIVQAIARLADTLHLNVIAEGIESGDQLSVLREMGIHSAQGYYYAAAMPFEELVSYISHAGGANAEPSGPEAELFGDGLPDRNLAL